MMGAGETTILTKVVFRSALPSIFTGLRLGIGIAWTAVIVAEMIAVKSGPRLRVVGRVLRRPHGHLRGDDADGRPARLRLDRAPPALSRVVLNWRTMEATRERSPSSSCGVWADVSTARGP
jgi:hypothetical protein